MNERIQVNDRFKLDWGTYLTIYPSIYLSIQVNDRFKLDWGTYLTTSEQVIYGLIDGRGSGFKVRYDNLLIYLSIYPSICISIICLCTYNNSVRPKKKVSTVPFSLQRYDYVYVQCRKMFHEEIFSFRYKLSMTPKVLRRELRRENTRIQKM